MLRKLIPLILMGAVVVSCNNPKTDTVKTTDSTETPIKSEVTDTEHNSQNSIDVTGKYVGVLPCADCEGIKTELTLDGKSHTYILATEYLGKEKNVFKTNGTYKWSEDGNNIILDKDDTMYKVGEGKLIHLDIEGNVISGDLASKYILTKQ